MINIYICAIMFIFIQVKCLLFVAKEACLLHPKVYLLCSEVIDQTLGQVSSC